MKCPYYVSPKLQSLAQCAIEPLDILVAPLDTSLLLIPLNLGEERCRRRIKRRRRRRKCTRIEEEEEEEQERKVKEEQRVRG